ncbi:MAG: EAL domain-containing protein [Gammaproteobacteria bacterium]|nr:EAL domain-containing protein [Gammaproteobacteria bacterium]MBU1409244.1 EAL domain-containing protein [Gammaproteobacteria bacterium]MBU1531140.1 EAL domain-containing protein [Gammaproteobacteria bacterium]
MSNQDKDAASDAGEPDAPDQAGTRREPSIAAADEAVLSREKSAAVRENAAHAREGEARIREASATLREWDLRSDETQAASDDRISRLQQANEHLVIATLEASVMAEEIQAAKDKLEYLVHYDTLTGLPNRALLQDRLGQAIELARRQGRQLALMFMDLDQFKHVNDSLGHPMGDQLLQSVAQRLVGCVRQSDTVSRQGGDEFVLLLPYIEHAEDAALSAQKVLAALAPPHHLDEHDLHIGASIGISIYPNDGRDAETLIKCADTAMYDAKESGRNTYKFFEPRMNAQAVQRQSIEASLRLALERQEFVLHYQPKIDLQRGTTTGVEALIRWQHPQRGLLAPAQFVPIAEDCGLILPIGRWVLREACNQAQAWLQAGLPPITISVNASTPEFHAVDYPENVGAALEAAHLEPRYLELDLTESVLMRDVASTESVLHALADLGVKLAVDDFGTGYSSLSYLRKYPIDTLKIDQSFVNRMLGNADDAAIVSAVISLAKSLRLRVIAEGVETFEQVQFLRARHCDEAQGYYFGRPVAAEALATLLQAGTAH